jgi:death-on-curing protein
VDEPRWVSKEALRLLHKQGLRRFGGADGLRDEGLLDSALARPQHRFAYEEESDVCRLAASYAAGIAKNHPFIDGNKRAAFAAVGLFLLLNGLRLTAPQPMATVAMLDLAAGEMTEEEFATWLRDHTAPRN